MNGVQKLSLGTWQATRPGGERQRAPSSQKQGRAPINLLIRKPQTLNIGAEGQAFCRLSLKNYEPWAEEQITCWEAGFSFHLYFYKSTRDLSPHLVE